MKHVNHPKRNEKIASIGSQFDRNKSESTAIDTWTCDMSDATCAEDISGAEHLNRINDTVAGSSQGRMVDTQALRRLNCTMGMKSGPWHGIGFVDSGKQEEHMRCASSAKQISITSSMLVGKPGSNTSRQ